MINTKIRILESTIASLEECAISRVSTIKVSKKARRVSRIYLRYLRPNKTYWWKHFFIEHLNYAVYYSAFRLSGYYNLDVAEKQETHYLSLFNLFSFMNRTISLYKKYHLIFFGVLFWTQH